MNVEELQATVNWWDSRRTSAWKWNTKPLVEAARMWLNPNIDAAMREVMEISERVDQASNRVVSEMEARRIVAAAFTPQGEPEQ